MNPRTVQAFLEELDSISVMEKEAFPKAPKALLQPAKRAVKKALTVKERIQQAARNASIHLYVKGGKVIPGKAVRKAIEIGEDMTTMNGPNPPKRHM